jgi:nitroimidazol reductase NimA-like FMN-containing flavoprotein (pyridoxamine 5'-phosphate oxidase superfamily)
MKTNLNAKERSYVARARICHVGSTARDGSPHTAPVSPAYDSATRTLYVATERAGRTAINLRVRSRASIAFDDYSEDWGHLHGVMLRARASKLERGARFEHAVRLLRKKFRQYKDIEIDYVIALQIDGVVASWGLSSSRR